jgi:hypothetical protein
MRFGGLVGLLVEAWSEVKAILSMLQADKQWIHCRASSFMTLLHTIFITSELSLSHKSKKVLSL